ncbi:MAG: hypothetical protein ACJ77A_12955 [Actinomycetota bacterium]
MRVRAMLLVATLLTLSGCRASHRAWTDLAGHTQPARTISEFRGPGHCGLESTWFLGFYDHSYVESDSSIKNPGTPPFLANTPLPTDAIDTGFRRGDEALWVGPQVFRGTYAAVYVKFPDHVERWPRADFGCA